ncbi:GAS2-like protein 2 [Heterocephalus glaber]|uniref:GAS2-like protein 2 n=1 Tax=Heterocephalus glaber TaxID=10181 RepID=G5B748_HETGA|nr:GAS2-like protein 2 [Heterocephalus glaber]EHB05109.1 GAS2-like protein 2 [Heterocephalus glaber]
MSQLWGHRKRHGALGPPVRSIRPFKSSEQYLEAMKEDLAEWLRHLYGLDIDAANFLQVLETGLVLCQHANMVTEAALSFLAEAPAQAQRIPMPQAGVSCNGAAQPGTFQARDNVSNFIQWCRKEMGIQEVLMFETEDLVLRKNVKNVVLCLLELGRRAWRFGVAAPTLVQLEEEIDEELRQDLALPPPDPPRPAPPPRRPCHFRNLDQMVQNLVSHCTCPVQFSMVKVSEGKYRVGDSNTLIFIRILRNHVMVRVGGGWDTLGHYLDKHDPCRCTSLSHKPVSFLKPPAPPVQHEVKVQGGPSLAQPTMTISRSQSPLPPVDWKTYTASGRQLRPPSSSSPRPCSERGAGSGVLRQTAPFLRSQERFLTSSWRQLSSGDSLPSPQFSPTHRDQGLRCTPSGKREIRYPEEAPRGRTPESWLHEESVSWGTHARAPTPQKPPAPRATTNGTSARGPPPLPHSSSPAQPLGHVLPPRGEAEGASLQLREPASVRAPSPAKALTKLPIRLSPSCPPTPGRSFPGTLSRGPTAELSRGPIPVRAVMGHLAGSGHEDSAVEGRSQGAQQADVQVSAEAGEPQDLGPQEWDGRCTPLPLSRTKEQTIYHSPEEEIVANVKKLEVGSAHPQGAEPPVIPRSGVYVPSLGGRWPEPGGLYDQVIQELAQGPPPLLKVDLEAWNVAPTGSPKPAVTAGPGSTKEKLGARDSGPLTKASLSARGTKMWKVSPPGGQDCSAPKVSSSPEVPTPLPSNPSSDKAKGCQGKGKRTLRKPKRVPSIYKLKLRPRIRPRRDHRPEKHPSRIPKPLAYLCLGPARLPPRERPLRAALGSKRGEVAQVDGASAREEDEEKKKEPQALLERSPPPWEGQGSQQLDQAQLPSEEESWV